MRNKLVKLIGTEHRIVVAKVWEGIGDLSFNGYKVSVKQDD